jgi:hypothetical protein
VLDVPRAGLLDSINVPRGAMQASFIMRRSLIISNRGTRAAASTVAHKKPYRVGVLHDTCGTELSVAIGFLRLSSWWSSLAQRRQSLLHELVDVKADGQIFTRA